jgi:hypothetical protein
MIKGKFVYMSPEQSLAKRLDKRSDIFAAGISLYEMLTGVNPFHKNNIVLTLEAIQRYEPPPPSEYDPSYAPFDPIIAKALAKDRDRRYSDAGEMQDDLRRVVLPRPPERLGQFMCRVFRAQLEEEQKLLFDSDRARIGGAGPRRTPPRATPPSASFSTVPDLPAAEGGRQLLRGAAARAKAPSRPPAPAKGGRPQQMRPDGAGDTLVDTEGGAPPYGSDDAPGGTLMLNPPASGGGGTELLGVGAPRSPARRAPPPGKASTNILTPEESEEAQRQAQAKLEEAKRAVVHTRTRNDKRAELLQARNNRGMWIALGVGTLAAVALIVGLLFLFFADESAAPAARRPRRVEIPESQSTPAPDPGTQR